MREVSQLEIFMEQELRFVLNLGRMALLNKKIGPIMSNFLSQISWARKKNIVISALKSCIK